MKTTRLSHMFMKAINFVVILIMVMSHTSRGVRRASADAINPPIITEGDSTYVTMSQNSSPTPFNLNLHASGTGMLTWNIVDIGASHGTTTASGTGDLLTIVYTPATDYTGSDAFVVQVNNGNGGTDTIKVNVTVSPNTCTVMDPADTGPGTLRQCVLDLTSGGTIHFDTTVFPEASPTTIHSNQINITQGNITIDAIGAGVILDGSGGPAGSVGLFITSNGSIIKELQIINFPGDGIVINSGAKDNSIEKNIISGNGQHGTRIEGIDTKNNVIIGNYIGTDATGTTAIPNTGKGVYISDGASSNIIGGDTPEERNVISGNLDWGISISGSDTVANTISGNYIGINAGGTASIPNNGGAIFIIGAPQNVIGGTTSGERNIILGAFHIFGIDSNENVVIGNYIGVLPDGITAPGTSWNGMGISDGARNRVGGPTVGERNVISGNGNTGIYLWSNTQDNVIMGNFIGTDATGTVAVPNGNDGVGIADGSNLNIVGGANPGEGNLISGNHENGIGIYGSGTTNNTIIGNFIGLDSTGTAAIGNGYEGVWIQGAQSNVIGGTITGQRNIIAGNSDSGVGLSGRGTMYNAVLGNYIGTDASGTVAMGNGWRNVGIWGGAQSNIIGGSMIGEGNLISGSTHDGVGIWEADTSHNTVAGNYIGTDATGTATLPNSGNGVVIYGGAQYNTIGKGTSGDRNLISGNGGNGVTIYGTGTASNTISGNYIGTDATGKTAIPNTGNGVYISDGASSNTIGGDTPEERNVISGNDENGVTIGGTGTASNTISGNYIGTDVSGTIALGNGYRGVAIWGGTQYNIINNNLISGNGNDGVPIEGNGTMYNTVSSNYIGTDVLGKLAIGNTLDGFYLSAGAQHNQIVNNLISGNQNGIQIEGDSTMNNTISGNYIGTDASGTAAISNRLDGITINRGASYNIVGTNNTIAFNNGYGVQVDGSYTLNNTITQNSIFHNHDLGIALFNGGNSDLPAPTITSVDPATNVVSGTACANCTIEVFSGDDDEGKIYEGTTLADDTGNWSLTISNTLCGIIISATATDPAGDTSPFGNAATKRSLPIQHLYAAGDAE